jgi:hypothetical protein
LTGDNSPATPELDGRSKSVTNGRLSSRDEDAERVARKISEDIERLAGIIGSVKEEFCAERFGSLTLSLQLSTTRHGEIEVQLHRDVGLGPRCAWQVVDLLKGEFANPVGIHQHKPVRGIGRSVQGWFITGPVLQPEQVPVELGELSRFRGVEDGV